MMVEWEEKGDNWTVQKIAARSLGGKRAEDFRWRKGDADDREWEWLACDLVAS